MSVYSINTMLLGAVIMWGCGSNDKENGGSATCDNASMSGYRTIVQGDTTREYILHVPSGYDSGTPLPLVIAYHGNGECADQFASLEANLESTADSSNFILAYPQGVVRAKGANEWDPGDDGTQDINSNDLVFTEQLIADISGAYSVDASRIYAVGYSNGGMMAYGMACARGNLIAAAGIMSGIMLPGECNASEYTSIIHFHGTADDSLPYNGNSEYQSVQNVIDFWVAHNGISDATPTSSDLGGGVVRDEYIGGSEDTSVVLYTIDNGGHVWFSDSIGGEQPNQILWNFISQYNVNGRVDTSE
ncbi:MAG: PHB depolymerase family esterase [Myxococcota bacterium]|nr:PHB depolymerase family esterase [Myxococcota bacterium]